jgi:hypothetical protein
MRIDQARQNVQTGRLDNLACGRTGGGSDSHDAPAGNADCGLALTPWQDTFSAADKQIVMRTH